MGFSFGTFGLFAEEILVERIVRNVEMGYLMKS